MFNRFAYILSNSGVTQQDRRGSGRKQTIERQREEKERGQGRRRGFKGNRTSGPERSTTLDKGPSGTDAGGTKASDEGSKPASGMLRQRGNICV